MMTDHQVEDRSIMRRLWLCRAPLLIAAALICLITAFNLGRLVMARSPRNPWESLEVVEACRSLRGLPVYDSNPDGHATHMYGALVPWIQGQIFRWVGPNNVTGRLLTLVSALVAVTLLAVIMRGTRSAWYFLVAWALILGVNHRSGHYFAENRPDMPALMMGVGGILLLAYGMETRRGLVVVLGSSCLILGFFLKQTVSIYSAVPVIALFLRGRRPERSEIVLAAIPLAAMGVMMFGLKIANPPVYHYMVEIPRSYSIHWARVPKFAWELLLDSPLFLVLLGEWIIVEQASFRDDRRLFWLMATLAVAIPFSVLSFAKVGGWPNSEIPAFLAMTSFCVLRLPRLLRRLEETRSPVPARLATGVFLAVLMLMTTFPHLTKANNLIVAAAPWDDSYAEAISVTKDLPGSVVCPEDPTIPYYAKQRVVQNLFSEKDAHPVNGAWPPAIPDAVVNEFRTADYVVDVIDYWGENVNGELLLSFGFEPVEDDRLNPECYRIWRRTTAINSGETSRTAFHNATRARRSSN